MKSVHLNCKGLYSLGKEAYLRNIPGFCLFTRVHSMYENMVGPKNNILMDVFLIGATEVGTVGKFWILAFLEAL